MTFQVPLHIPEDLPLPETEAVTNEQITIIEAENSVTTGKCLQKCGFPILPISFAVFFFFPPSSSLCLSMYPRI